MRRDFSLKTLDEKDIPLNPMVLFGKWLNEAITSDALEPNAMILATATPDGKPSSRVVLLKKYTDQGFIFFTNYNSKKGIQIEHNKFCALNFVWHELERQIRVEGMIEKISETESDSYFELRPEKSKLGAWASPQSQVIPNREYLDEVMINFQKQFSNKNISRPLNWGGYIVKPYLFEFWQGRSNRLHDRIQYSLEKNIWKIERLAP